MSSRARWIAFGTAGVFVALGIVCAVLVGGLVGTLLAFVLIASGFVLATSLVFLEVGLSEDRELEQEYERRLRVDPVVVARRRLTARRLGRERAHRRTLD